MTVEVQVLGYAVLLAVVYLALYAIAANREFGLDYTTGSRDEQRVLSGVGGRLQRAYHNHIEGMVYYGAAVLLVSLSDASSPTSQTAAWMYLASRCAYLPAYVSGVPFLRSAIWAVGFFATLTMAYIGFAAT